MELLSKAAALSEIQQRRVTAIIGSLVADAAAQPIHWVYEGMQDMLEGMEHPEFRPTSANPYYNIPTGLQSPYGDQLITMLESLVASNGFDAADSARRMMVAFGPNSPYTNTGPQAYSKGMKDKSMYPIKGKWRNFVLNRFVTYFPTGVTLEDYIHVDSNVDPDNIVRLIPLVALYAGQPDMLQIAEEAALQLQVNDMITTLVLAACRIVQQFILHGEMGSEHQLKAVIAELKSPSRAHPQPLDLAVAVQLQKALDCREMDIETATTQFGKA
jgi:hypothetical protein